MWIKLGISVLVVGGCSVSTAQINTDWEGGLLAEGYSSPTTDRVADLHYRVFTTTSTICEELRELQASFESSPNRIVIKAGGAFSLHDLILRAKTSAGEFLPSIPITVSVYNEPGVLTRASTKERVFRATSVGDGVAIIQAACGSADPPVRLEIPVVVEG